MGRFLAVIILMTICTFRRYEQTNWHKDFLWEQFYNVFPLSFDRDLDFCKNGQLWSSICCNHIFILSNFPTPPQLIIPSPPTPQELLLPPLQRHSRQRQQWQRTEAWQGSRTNQEVRKLFQHNGCRTAASYCKGKAPKTNIMIPGVELAQWSGSWPTS